MDQDKINQIINVQEEQLGRPLTPAEKNLMTLFATSNNEETIMEALYQLGKEATERGVTQEEVDREYQLAKAVNPQEVEQVETALRSMVVRHLTRDVPTEEKKQ